MAPSAARDTVVVSHTVGGDGRLHTRVLGALSAIVIWGGGLFLGPAVPLLIVGCALTGHLVTAAVLTAVVVVPLLVKVPESPRFAQFMMASAGWLKGGATVHFTAEVLDAGPINDGTMVCYHPHGLLPFAFPLNGAVRAKTRKPEYQSAAVRLGPRVTGVQAPVLFRIPILNLVLALLGCCTPATRDELKRLMRERLTFGILPGGSEEVAVHETGAEVVYIRSRAGFIKYALQHGYRIVVAYSFGEAELYSSVSALRGFNLWLVKRFGFVLPVFAGWRWLPLLPRPDVPLNTVLGASIQLPRIEHPTSDDVNEWHAEYVRALQRVYEQHQARFGHADRPLVVR